MKIIEKKSASTNVQIEAFPAAKEKGEPVVLGSLVGFSDYKTGAGEAGSVTVGRPIAVFQIPKTDIETAIIGTDVYLTSALALSATETDNTLLGVVVAVGHDTFDVAVTG